MNGRVGEALAYPFAPPQRSYLLRGGAEAPLGEWSADGREALVAYGANAAPARLAAKLARIEEEVAVPVLRAMLHDFDVVYSAHVTLYGSIPGTLQRSPGTAVPVHVLFVREAELEALGATEVNYTLEELAGADVRLAEDAPPPRLHAYLSRHGCLDVEGSEAALAALPARERAFPERTQEQALEHARALLAPAATLEEFVLGHCGDAAVARERTAALRERAQPLRV